MPGRRRASRSAGVRWGASRYAGVRRRAGAQRRRASAWWWRASRTAGGRGLRTPLLLAVGLVGIGAAGPAAADRERPPGGLPEVSVVLPGVSVVIPEVSVRSPAPPRKVSMDGSVPGVKVWRSPVPGVSIDGRRPGKRRPVPKVAVPGMTIYPGAVCGERVRVGECPRDRPRAAPRAEPRRMTAVRVPSPSPSPTSTPTPTATSRVRVKQVLPPPRRTNPLGNVLVMVVLVSVIASTTAVAFGTRR
ncbi:hypothetical protein EDD27_2918 [Nonomuraea polychroma]|uniref:Uncharacterized protein n=1 Tax=Nonomuraea polychroma TaxID=46176 RepID=A0A438M4J7_9ACTN|nr:hypothetical protein [Nonomuraea polychroma]RVX40507.1 hypothetical protein EDD27_2918 [Nonomuraea polychroma]